MPVNADAQVRRPLRGLSLVAGYFYVRPQK